MRRIHPSIEYTKSKSRMDLLKDELKSCIKNQTMSLNQSGNNVKQLLSLLIEEEEIFSANCLNYYRLGYPFKFLITRDLLKKGWNINFVYQQKMFYYFILPFYIICNIIYNTI